MRVVKYMPAYIVIYHYYPFKFVELFSHEAIEFENCLKLSSPYGTTLKAHPRTKES